MVQISQNCGCNFVHNRIFFVRNQDAIHHSHQLTSHSPFMRVAGAKQYLDSPEGNIELQLGSVARIW